MRKDVKGKEDREKATELNQSYSQIKFTVDQ